MLDISTNLVGCASCLTVKALLLGRRLLHPVPSGMSSGDEAEISENQRAAQSDKR